MKIVNEGYDMPIMAVKAHDFGTIKTAKEMKLENLEDITITE